AVLIAGTSASVDRLVMPIVVPSGAALAIAAAAIGAPAAVRFSTTNCCLNVTDRCSATTRASVSPEPPAPNGTMIFTGRSGQGSAAAGEVSGRSAARRRASEVRRLITKASGEQCRCVIMGYAAAQARRHGRAL